MPSIAGLLPTAAHLVVVNTLKALTGAAARLAVVNAHPPALTRPASGIGGTNLCDVCSPGQSRVGWPCPPYRAAAAPDITGMG